VAWTPAAAQQQAVSTTPVQRVSRAPSPQTLASQAAATAPALEQRIAVLEERLNIALELKEQKLQEVKERIENLYKLLEFIVALATVTLLFFSIRDFLLRWKEGQRQRGIDDIVKEMLNLQNAAVGQQVAFGRLQLKAAEENPTQQFEPVKRVSEVIRAVQQTLAFRLEQDEKFVATVREIETIKNERERTRRQRFEHAVGIMGQFKKMARMEFAALAAEQYKRGVKLRGLVDDLEESINGMGYETAGDLLYFSGILAYYDNDVIEARDYLDRAAQCRATDHEGTLTANPSYRIRFAFIHYFRALIQKNWGDLSEALSEIERSAKLLESKEGEFLTPVTKVEIRSYVVGGEQGCREELEGLLRQMDGLENALKNQGKRLDSNQSRLRNRVLVFLGNTYFVAGKFQDALNQYARALRLEANDYYALASAAQCCKALGQQEAAAEHFKRCLNAIERSGDFGRKREIIGRAVIAVIAANAAKGCGDQDRYERYAREARDMLSGNLAVDSMSPKFFSPATKRLVSSSELLRELE
jgi:tetratricopeptide (TPR) repeat protein